MDKPDDIKGRFKFRKILRETPEEHAKRVNKELDEADESYDEADVYGYPQKGSEGISE